MLNETASASIVGIFLNLVLCFCIMFALAIVDGCFLCDSPTYLDIFTKFNITSVLFVQGIISTIFFVPLGFCAVTSNAKVLKYSLYIYGAIVTFNILTIAVLNILSQF